MAERQRFGEDFARYNNPPPPIRLRPRKQFHPVTKEVTSPANPPRSAQPLPPLLHDLYPEIERTTPQHPYSKRPESTPQEKEQAIELINSFYDHPKRLRKVTDTLGITDDVERNYAAFLLRKSPDLVVVYEPILLKPPVGDPNSRGTLPDFFIHNPKSSTPEVPIFIDVTRAELTHHDSKARQRAVMEKAIPGAKYVTLYWHNLRNIQASHPDIFTLPKRDFFPATQLASVREFSERINIKRLT